MSQVWVGKCIIQKSTQGKTILSGRVICVNLEEGLLAYVPFPKVVHGRRDNYVPSPRIMPVAKLAESLDGSNGVALVDFQTPEHWLWHDNQLDSKVYSGPLRRHRRKLMKWKAIRESSYDLIKPFVDGRTPAQIISDPQFPSWPRTRSVELGHKNSVKVRRALNAFLLGLADKRALLPWYIDCGAPGRQKFTSTQTGRPDIGEQTIGTKKSRPCLSPETRAKLALGWKRYKKKGISDKVALGQTRNDYFVKAMSMSKHGVKVELLPEAYDISPQMFRYWGKKDPKTIRSIDHQRGMSPIRDEMRRRLNKAKDRFDTLNGVAYIDSTSTDQTLISSVYPLKRLMSPWRTEVLAASIDYIFGMYVGFESVSATTALLAVLNAASDKVALCAKYGHTIEPRDWYSCTFNTLYADNGEGKGKVAMYSLEQMSATASYGKAYDAINKAASESGHHRRQKRIDHLIPGTTMGRQKVRGELDRALAAGLRFDDYMHLLLKEILHHNNHEYIDLPRLEMYPGIKERTRRGVVEWLMEHHYLSSSAVDISLLKVMCLPRFKAVMQGDGIHIFVPGTGSAQLIKRLVYRSEYLIENGSLHQANRKTYPLEVHMDPTDPTAIWANIAGLKRFELTNADSFPKGFTLIDWIGISEDDKLAAFLAKRTEIDHLSDKLANINHRHKVNKKAREEAIEHFGKPTKAQIRRDVRSMTEMEIALLTGIPAKSSISVEEEGDALTAVPAKKGNSEPVRNDHQPAGDWLDIAANLYAPAKSSV